MNMIVFLKDFVQCSYVHLRLEAYVSMRIFSIIAQTDALIFCAALSSRRFKTLNSNC